MTALSAILVVFASIATPQETPQEKRKVPNDSIELTVIGCLKGRVLKTVDERKADVETGPYVGSRSFHLASKKQVTEEIKSQQGHLVEVTGIVKRSALDDKGIKVGRRHDRRRVTGRRHAIDAQPCRQRRRHGRVVSADAGGVVHAAVRGSGRGVSATAAEP